MRKPRPCAPGIPYSGGSQSELWNGCRKGPESAQDTQETKWKGHEKADPHYTSRGQACGAGEGEAGSWFRAARPGPQGSVDERLL